MDLLRKAVKININVLDLSLQLSFDNKYVETIISPVEEPKNDNSKIYINKAEDESKNLQDFLLNGPVMSDNDYEYFLEINTQFNKWK